MEELQDILPPEPVFELQWWMIALLIAMAVMMAAVIVWIVVKRLRAKPEAPPVPPRAVALAALEMLRSRLSTTPPHEFTIAVSEVLRRYVGDQYSMRAVQQTSAEFLAHLEHRAVFDPEDKALLSGFLEQCDLIKFARIGETESAKEALLSSAFAFIQGARL